uniref:L,D-transpeptidase family protein n=1 Tax=Streptomyces polyasparticus TaxID=2767826 RepID=UPI00280C1B1D|nr:L,D-transpeptidase [Streptomyces polyasparticus]
MAAVAGVMMLGLGVAPAVADGVPAPVSARADDPGELRVEDPRAVAWLSSLPGYADAPDQGVMVPEGVRALPEGLQRDPRPLPQLPSLERVPASEILKRAPFCTRRTGPRQRELERFLKLRVDGKQSAADCKAIQRFQIRAKIIPDTGYAGPVTWGLAKLMDAIAHPNAGGRCPVRRRRIVCADLNRQLLWVQKGRKITYGPVPIRTGRPGLGTRTGWYSIYFRVKDFHSTLYNAPMPYSQFFSGGQAFHGTYADIYSPPGSHGCVNLRFADAKRLWSAVRQGDAVYVWGRRPAN